MSDQAFDEPVSPKSIDRVIPIWRVVGNAYSQTIDDLGRVYLLAWKPWLVALVLTFIIGFLDGLFALNSAMNSTLGVLITYIFNAYFALAMHRYRLFGWNENTSSVKFQFKSSEQIFAGYAAVVFLISSLLPFLARTMVSGSLALIAVVASLLMIPAVAMIALTLPAAAVNREKPIVYGWNIGVGSWMRVLAVIILCALPVIILTPLTRPFASNHPIIFPLLISIVSYPLSAITINAICAMYTIRSRDAMSAPV